MIALSCGIKISTVHYSVLSQSTHVTERQTDGQNYDSQDRPRICSCGNYVKSSGLTQKDVQDQCLWIIYVKGTTDSI